MLKVFKKKLLFLMAVASIGIFYSGTLTYNYLTAGSCSPEVQCPFLFGYPICMYALSGFLVTIFMAATMYVNASKLKQTRLKSMTDVIFWISLVGSLFALYFLVVELFIQAPPTSGKRLTFFFPSCLYGLALFALIYGFSRAAHNAVDENFT